MEDLTARPRTQSTLLIPNRLVGDFFEKTDEIGREIYFHFLIKKYSPLIISGAFGKREAIKRCYQQKGEKLVKKNFRPINSDWVEFGLLAEYLGLSMAALFTMLLKFDLGDWAGILGDAFFGRGVPPKIARLTSRIHLNYSQMAQIYRKMRFKTKR